MAKIRLMIVDDEVDLLAELKPLMERSGYEVLSASNARALLIPRGFAHGFQALSQDCELLYLHSSAYAPQAEGALNVRDPRLAIAWPEPISELSPRDANHPLLGNDFAGIQV